MDRRCTSSIPLTMEGSAGDAMEREDRPHYYSDDHLWGVLAVCAYLKETGDLEFLDEEIPFYEKDRQEQALKAARCLSTFAGD
jgi:cellobiose phosphorylase